MLAYGVKDGKWLKIKANESYTIDTEHNYYHHPKITNWQTKGGQILYIHYYDDKGNRKSVANILVAKGTVKQGKPQDGAMQFYLKCFNCADDTAVFKIKEDLCYEASALDKSGRLGKAEGCFESVE